MAEDSRVGAVIVAAGESRRMGTLDKVFAPLGGRPLLAWAIDAFQSCPSVDEVVLVLNERNLELGQRLVEEHGWSKVAALCRGGERRQDSVREGLARISGCHWAIVHDGARPCVTPGLIEEVLAAAAESGAAIAAVPVVDTIKLVSGDGFVEETAERSSLWMAQTPQAFRSDIISRAHRQQRGDASDDALMVEGMGHRVRVCRGSYENIKVTTPEDMAMAEALLRKRDRG